MPRPWGPSIIGCKQTGYQTTCKPRILGYIRTMTVVNVDNLPATRTDPVQPTRDLAKLPMISAEQYQHVGRFAGALVLSTFEMIGGLPRMASWADDNPTDFYTKLFP